MTPDTASRTEARFRHYTMAKTRPGELLQLGEKEGKRFVVYEPRLRRLAWLEVFEDNGTIAGERLEALRLLLKTCARAEHEGLIPVMETGEDDGLLYVVREVASGEEIERYVPRLRQGMGVWDALDLAMQLADIYGEFAGRPEQEAAGTLSPREALIDLGDRNRLRLKLEILPTSAVIASEATATGAESGEARLIRSVCDLLHYCLAGGWIPVDGNGRRRPALGELPVEVRFLVWSICQDKGTRGPASLGELRSALGELRIRTPRQPIPREALPQCRLARLLFPSCDVAALFRLKYLPDGARVEADGPYCTGVLQQPFGYALHLQALPGADLLCDPAYARHLESLAGTGGGTEEGGLRTFASAALGDACFVVEEKVNGPSLARAASLIGGFEPAEALEMVTRVHENLARLEARGRTPWNLSPANCLLHFERRIEGDLAGVLSDKVAQWPPFRIILRLHPTTGDLLEGGAGEGNPAAGLAALFWRLVSFRPWLRALAPDGSFRPLGRLRDDGNTFLRATLTTPARGETPARSRETFLAEARTLLRDGAFDGGSSAAPSAPEDGACDLFHASPPRADSGVLVRAPRREAEAAPRSLSLLRCLAHAAMILVLVAIIGVCAMGLHPVGRNAILTQCDRLFQKFLDAGSDEADPPVASDFPVPASALTAVSFPASSPSVAVTTPPCGPPASTSQVEIADLDAILRSVRASGQHAWDETALDSLRRAADAGAPHALLCLGDALFAAGDASAITCYRECAFAEDPLGMRVYAECLWAGRGVEADAEEALLWYRKADAAGDEGARAWLADFAARGKSGVPPVRVKVAGGR